MYWNNTPSARKILRKAITSGIKYLNENLSREIEFGVEMIFKAIVSNK